jgi:hypothetical protein
VLVGVGLVLGWKKALNQQCRNRNGRSQLDTRTMVDFIFL